MPSEDFEKENFCSRLPKVTGTEVGAGTCQNQVPPKSSVSQMVAGGLKAELPLLGGALL